MSICGRGTIDYRQRARLIRHQCVTRRHAHKYVPSTPLWRAMLTALIYFRSVTLVANDNEAILDLPVTPNEDALVDTCTGFKDGSVAACRLSYVTIAPGEAQGSVIYFSAAAAVRTFDVQVTAVTSTPTPVPTGQVSPVYVYIVCHLTSSAQGQNGAESSSGRMVLASALIAAVACIHVLL